MNDDWPLAHGGAPLIGKLRSTPEDFFVDEILGFEPDGVGEHVFVRVEKRGANTEWVARELAKFSDVDSSRVSYSGLKDRHAVTRQTFSIHLPGLTTPDFESLQHDEFRVLSSARHGRKLKRGAHKGNLFEIILRDAQGDVERARGVVVAIARDGVPNYFGEQRFGRDAANVERAIAMFGGRRVQRHERSLLLSAARSHVFNLVLSERVRRGDWNRAVNGDVWMLSGSHSIFGPKEITDALVSRCATGDIAPTGPMWGSGELRTTDIVAEIERSVAQANFVLADGLAQAGLKQERRALVLRPEQLVIDASKNGVVSLSFGLPAGAYATTIIREICRTS